ncbi:hypothetical protein HG536_0B05550 [Torulaspora globosa]|uniref:Uncharacterized protein n=1 Tax=Torulaspora globosa TaxID=48254 RepID=A0A7G3ZDV4_9SACH|nr:uncharacterized protein HG536_0B05550 [Torulaspora globosa]QLL31690.1 hypothetical protein HG536_0B05550 [Torulaspora globosa]
MVSSRGSISVEAEYRKLLSRNDELTKQEATLKKEYTTLLRKISSLARVLSKMEPDMGCSSDEPRLISEAALVRAPRLRWYNEQISLVESLSRENQEIPIPDELMESYRLSKDTPLLHRDSN